MEKDPVSVKYYLSDVYLDTLRKHRARHESAGHGFGYEIKDLDGVSSAMDLHADYQRKMRIRMRDSGGVQNE